MLIGFISDTHGYHNKVKIPDNLDILIHCGDISNVGELPQVKSFIEWFGNQKAKHKIFINGNHEVQVSKLGNLTRVLVNDHNKYHFTNIHYLEEEGVEIEGLKFWGSPYTPEFFDWVYLYNREDGERRWIGIPPDTDVLITHGPPAGILDTVKPFGRYPREKAGCDYLLDKVMEIKPKIHAFGHIHEHHDTIRIPELDTLFVNASTCTDSYVPSNPVIVVDTETWEVV